MKIPSERKGKPASDRTSTAKRNVKIGSVRKSSGRDSEGSGRKSSGRKSGKGLAGKKPESGTKTVWRPKIKTVWNVKGWVVAGIMALVISAVLCVPAIVRYFTAAGSGDYAPSLDGSVYCYMIDMSHHNGEVYDWKNLKILLDADGKMVSDLSQASRILPVSAIYLKASEGGGWKDKAYKKLRRRTSRVKDLSAGAYHYYLPKVSGMKQADNFISSVGKIDAGDLPPVLDIEEGERLGSEKACHEAEIWLEEVEKRLGCTPVVYCNRHYYNNVLTDRIKSRYPIWIAAYNSISPAVSSWVAWQFSDRGLVYGIRGYVDVSAVRRDFLRSRDRETSK